MEPEKNTLKEEIEHRIALLEESMKAGLKDKKSEDNLYWFYANEHSIHTEFLRLINIFEGRIGHENFKIERYTPIKDYITKEPLRLDDKVKSYSSTANGILHFDDYTNQYVIRNEFGQHNKTSAFIKIEENYDYSIDNSKVECRPNPHKKLW